jgi:hypothetical protein
MAKRVSLGLAVLLAVSLPLSIDAQAMGDESRLVVGVHGGFIGGTDLWSVNSQPVFVTPDFNDQFRLDRSLRSNITLNGQLHYFPKPWLGWTAELGFIGLGTKDRCTMLTPKVGLNSVACNQLDQEDRAASAITGMVGAIVRMNSRGDVQPYLRASVGIALVPRSTTAVTSIFRDPISDDDFAIVIYEDNGSRAAKPVVAVGFGLATSPRRGYQFRFEARMQGVQLEVVDGPTDVLSRQPDVSSKWLFLPNLTLGMDIVLEKRRGRRY